MNGRTNSNNNTTGLEIEVPLDPVTDVSANAGNGQVELTWTDPLDKYAATEGEVAESPNPIVSQWDHTRVVRKENTQPTGPNDGVIVLSSDVRNQYQSTSYVDSGLINDTMYHYGLFACNSAGLFSTGAFGSATPKAGTPLSQLSEGTLINILENGAPVEFYVAKQNYEEALNGSGRTLLLRHECYNQQSWDRQNRNTFSTSSILSWLNSSYLSLFTSSVRSMIGSTSFKCSPGGDNIPDLGTITLTFPVFILSSAELGKGYISDGDRLPIIGMPGIGAEKAQLNGVYVDQWTRTPRKSVVAGVNVEVNYLNTSGQRDHSRCDYVKGIRPCLTLPSTVFVDAEFNLI